MFALRALLVGVVSVAMALSPLLGRWPGTAPDDPMVASAQSSGPLESAGNFRFVAADNDNDGGDNGNHNDNGNGDDDDDGDDDGDDDDTPDGGAGRENVTARVAPGAGPPAGAGPVPSEASACLQAGQQLTIGLDRANAALRNVTGSVQATLRRVDPNSVPATPGPRMTNVVFELTGGPCGGAAGAQLPQEVNLGVSYQDAAATGLNEANLTLARLVGGAWVAVTKGAADPANNFVSATIQETGTYTVYQK